jgi:hypothetical protein
MIEQKWKVGPDGQVIHPKPEDFAKKLDEAIEARNAEPKREFKRRKLDDEVAAEPKRKPEPEEEQEPKPIDEPEDEEQEQDEEEYVEDDTNAANNIRRKLWRLQTALPSRKKHEHIGTLALTKLYSILSR